jgi:hypothetical protein
MKGRISVIQFHFDVVQILGLLSGIVLPLIVGLVTSRVTAPGVKATILAALAVVISLLTEISAALTSHTAYNLGNALLVALGTFLVSVGIHYGLWKPTTVSAKLQAVGSK